MIAIRDLLIGIGVGLAVGIPVFLALTYFTLKKTKPEELEEQPKEKVETIIETKQQPIQQKSPKPFITIGKKE